MPTYTNLNQAASKPHELSASPRLNRGLPERLVALRSEISYLCGHKKTFELTGNPTRVDSDKFAATMRYQQGMVCTACYAKGLK